jgi:hypothetical protein
MKAWSVIGLLFAATIFATIPISPQVTPRGVELSVDAAKAITYGRYRRVSRRVTDATIGMPDVLTAAATTTVLPPTTLPGTTAVLCAAAVLLRWRRLDRRERARHRSTADKRVSVP